MENSNMEFKIIKNLLKPILTEEIVSENKENKEIEKSAMLKFSYFNAKCFDTTLMKVTSEKEIEELVYTIINFNKSIEQLQEKASSDIYAMNELGERYYYANMYDEAFELFEKAENGGCIRAKYNKIVLLGKMYYNGDKGNQDYKKAFELFSQAQEINAQAKYYLSKMYLFGYGVEEDEKTSEKLIDEAVRMRDKDAIQFIFNYNANMVKLMQEFKLDKNCSKEIMKKLDSLNVKEIKSFTQKENEIIDVEGVNGQHFIAKIDQSNGTYKVEIESRIIP